MHLLPCRALLILLSLSTTATAQQPGPGLSWSGTLGGATGSFLPGCVTLPVTAMASETITIRVWGDPMSAWLLAASVSATQCLALAPAALPSLRPSSPRCADGDRTSASARCHRRHDGRHQ